MTRVWEPQTWKDGMTRINLPWHYFRGMWTGLCIGFFIGTLAGIHYHKSLAGSPSAGIIWAILACGYALVAFLPDAVAHIVGGFRRFKAASR